MSSKRGKKWNAMFGQLNAKRCFTGALVSVAFFPVLLLLSMAEPELLKAYRIPGAFFSVSSAAFAYLFYQLLKNKAKQYYPVVIGVYLTVFHLFFAYAAVQNIWIYYVAVVLAAYMVCLSMEQYAVMALSELVCYAAIVLKSGMQEVSAVQLTLLAVVHLFAFFLSRDYYITKKNHLVEEKKLRKEMQAAERDPMTGLLNRRGLERHVEEVWGLCAKRQETVAVFVMDIDLFKSYNDRFGHVQGDVCIQQVARSIAATVKGNGIAARIGGEEFLVFVRNRSVQEIYNLAEQIRADVEDMRISRGAGSGVITVSIGVDVRYASEDINLQGMYGRADRQLYQAKEDGRNCVRNSHMMRERRSRIG